VYDMSMPENTRNSKSLDSAEQINMFVRGFTDAFESVGGGGGGGGCGWGVFIDKRCGERIFYTTENRDI